MRDSVFKVGSANILLMWMLQVAIVNKGMLATLMFCS